MRVLELPAGAGPLTWGRIHGETFRHEIKSLAALRTHLCRELGRFDSEEAVWETARRHLPVLKAFHPELHTELLGIAEGANLDPAGIVVLNHYTDLRDLDPASLSDDDCSAIYARTAAGPVLAQTWDMHASAMPFVMMLGVPREGAAPAAWVFTLTGCLGMTGMNERGLGITINNLKSTDARVGVVWPALVRRVLLEGTSDAAGRVVVDAPVGSGHHYLVADDAAAFGIETSGVERRVVYSGGSPAYVHTNHCLDAAVKKRTVVSPDSTTFDRYDRLARSVESDPPDDVHDVWTRLGSTEGWPRSVCTYMVTPDRPHAMATCGGIAMDLGSKEVWAAGGLIHAVTPQRFVFS